jgi:putative transposon-encoded protein
VINIKEVKDDVLVSYDAVVKPQGGGGRIWPNPLPEHVGKVAKVIIFDKESLKDPERLVLQIQNQLRCIRG